MFLQQFIRFQERSESYCRAMVRVSRKLLLRECGPTLLPLGGVHTRLQGLLNNCWTTELYLLYVETAVICIGQSVKYFTPAGMVS
jgi:hypothetical protein